MALPENRGMESTEQAGPFAASSGATSRGGDSTPSPDVSPPQVPGDVAPDAHGPRRWFRSAMLWMLVLLVTFCMLVYQRRTGPTYPYRGSVAVEGRSLGFELIRSEESTRDARVSIPDPGANFTASLFYRRYPTAEAFVEVPMRRESADVTSDGNAVGPETMGTGAAGRPSQVLVAELPRQPAAGKLEYFIEIWKQPSMGAPTVPADPEVAGTPRVLSLPSRTPIATIGGAEHRNIVIRFKDPVPAAVLLPHILFMLVAILFGIRAGIAAMLAPRSMHGYAWLTLAGLTIGGMILGPIVQKYAFGAYWTGFPFGGDLTDNKTLIMWGGWLVACLIVGWRFRPVRRSLMLQRGAVLAAAVVMIAAYLIPHSMRGSELDYAAVDAGADPAEAVGTSSP